VSESPDCTVSHADLRDDRCSCPDRDERETWRTPGTEWRCSACHGWLGRLATPVGVADILGTVERAEQAEALLARLMGLHPKGAAGYHGAEGREMAGLLGDVEAYLATRGREASRP